MVCSFFCYDCADLVKNALLTVCISYNLSVSFFCKFAGIFAVFCAPGFDGNLHLSCAAVIADDNAVIHVFPAYKFCLEFCDILGASCVFFRNELSSRNCTVVVADKIDVGEGINLFYIVYVDTAVSDFSDYFNVFRCEDVATVVINADSDYEHRSENIFCVV